MTAVERAIFRAIESREFIPYFQPMVELRSGRIEGFEILARWPHPRRGLLTPGEFIQPIERNGLMNGLAASLLTKTFAAAKSLPEDFGFSVNVSPSQLHDRALPALFRSLAEEASFDLHRLTIEMTESALLDDLDLACLVADELKSLGVRLSLDDFGTGYSSLLHLRSLPFDELKVDSSFVRSMLSHRQSRKITASVVGLGQSLGLRTVAEGVEERAQAEMLIWHGCDLGQGWLYSPAVPAEQLPAVIEQHVTHNHILANVPPEVAGSALDAHPTDRLPQLRAIYDGAPVGLGFVDRDLRYINLNQRLAEMHGVTLAAHLGRGVKEVVPEIFAQVEPYFRRALAGEPVLGVTVKNILATPGSTATNMIASYQPARDESGEVIGVSVSVLDVSRTRRRSSSKS